MSRSGASRAARARRRRTRLKRMNPNRPSSRIPARISAPYCSMAQTLVPCARTAGDDGAAPAPPEPDWEGTAALMRAAATRAPWASAVP